MVPTGEKILSQQGMALSQENLERFKIKSGFMVPACFGGFDQNDPVCKDYCFRARQSDLEIANWAVLKKLNEEKSRSGGGFFYPDFKFSRSCQQERKGLEARLAKAKKDMEEDLERRDEERSMRDHYYLSENSQGLGRIPVGEVRDNKDFRDFTKSNMLYLETKDTRLFLNPYGPGYDEAVGKIQKIDPGGHTDFGFVKSITPKLPNAQRYRIKVTRQTENNGNLVLEAQVTDEYGNSGINGQKLTIEVYGPSAKENIKVDDVGKL